jgi:hypothetical protein
MSARTVRRNFASPFVLTLAACGSSQSAEPPHANPPGPTDVQPPHGNPPAPTDVQPPANPPPPTTADPSQQHLAPPSDSKPAPTEQFWTVMKSGDHCEAYSDQPCRPGGTCNPPAPQKIECPATATLPVKVRGYNGVCTIARAAEPCPPNAKCNPPPPQRVKCPE